MAVNWMERYFMNNADKMPDANGQRGAWNLPSNTTKDEVYKQYQQWATANAEFGKPISDKYFLALWREQFEHVNIPFRSRFAQCDE